MVNNITFQELCEKLKDLDEITLIETLNLSSDIIVDKCEDIIEERFEELCKQFEEEKDELDDGDNTI
jgi:hypothetical protein